MNKRQKKKEKKKAKLISNILETRQKFEPQHTFPWDEDVRISMTRTVI